MTVRQLLTSMDSQEITEWMAYIQIESKKPEKKPEQLEAELKNSLMGLKR